MNGPEALETSPTRDGLPLVSVVMPIRNEVNRVGRSLAAVLAQDYPEDRTEILIADGGSEDGTLEVIRGVIAGHRERRITLLESVVRTPGAALNRLIQTASGDIIVRVDGHAEIASDYVSACVAALESSDALNVGGYIFADGEGYIGRSIAMAIGSFWGNGGARFRGRPADCPVYADTVPFGAWRKETFTRLGMFADGWRVNEDCEFNARILDAGGRILLLPWIRAKYFPRGSLSSLARQYFRYGRLKGLVIARHPRRLRARQLAPLLLVLLLAGLAVAALAADRNALLFLLPAGIYLLTLTVASASLAIRRGRPDCALVLPGVFVILHLSYGLGSLLGAVQLMSRRFDRGLGISGMPQASSLLKRDPR